MSTPHNNITKPDVFTGSDPAANIGEPSGFGGDVGIPAPLDPDPLHPQHPVHPVHPGRTASVGLASGTGKAQSPHPGMNDSARLATGTGGILRLSMTSSAGLATGAGKAQSSRRGISTSARLATGTGAAQQPNADKHPPHPPHPE